MFWSRVGHVLFLVMMVAFVWVAFGAWVPHFGTASSCSNPTIKGNVNAKGQAIYHLPGDFNYDQVKIDQAQGDQMFCTTSEAQAAGFRAANYR